LVNLYVLSSVEAYGMGEFRFILRGFHREIKILEERIRLYCGKIFMLEKESDCGCNVKEAKLLI